MDRRVVVALALATFVAALVAGLWMARPTPPPGAEPQSHDPDRAPGLASGTSDPAAGSPAGALSPGLAPGSAAGEGPQGTPGQLLPGVDGPPDGGPSGVTTTYGPYDFAQGLPEGWSATREAERLFAGMKKDLDAAEPLDREKFKRVVRDHRDAGMEVLKEAGALSKAGYQAEGQDLVESWGDLYRAAQKRAVRASQELEGQR